MTVKKRVRHLDENSAKLQLEDSASAATNENLHHKQLLYLSDSSGGIPICVS